MSAGPRLRGLSSALMNLTGTIALVTGGATGIGRAACLALARAGASVAVNYSKSRDEAESAAAEVRALGIPGVKAFTVQADVADEAAVLRMTAEVADRLGPVDVLVNNAATTKFIPHDDLDAMTADLWDRIFDVNVKGAWFVSRAVGPAMKSRGRGAIINIASIAAYNGAGSCIAYAASKAALISLTKSLARVFAPAVRVNAVAPGFIETRWTAGQTSARDRFRAATPLARNGTPDDIAGAILHLATSDWTTGQVVTVDGGRTIV